MADFITISSNLDQFKKVFTKLGGADDVIFSFVVAAAFNAVKEAKMSAPIDEGTLRRSITAEYRPNLGEVYALIANVFYAPYIEFGTGERVEVPQELTNFAMQFKGKIPIKGQGAQPYLYPAALRAQENIKDYIVKWIKANSK